MLKYGKTPGFSEVVRSVKHTTNFIGLDDDGNPIFEDRPQPTIKFVGTVKLHGTNAGIGYNCLTKEHWYQSRNNKINNGHYGFVNEVPFENIKPLFEKIELSHCPDQIVVYGEWAGNGVQKSVAISNLSKAFYIFAICITKGEDKTWINPSLYCEMNLADNIKFIHKYLIVQEDINFNFPQLSLEKIQKLVDKIEERCPIAEAHGVLGVGEGLVFVGEYKNERLIFKVKGSKHSVVKKEKLPTDIDPEKAKKFIEYCVTPARVDQAVFELGLNSPSRKDTGNIVKWVANDIEQEEENTLSDLGLTFDQIRSFINKATATIFLSKV